MVARRPLAGRPVELARRDDGRGHPPLGTSAEAQARRDAAVGLPLHRPAGVPVQRHRLHRRPRRAPVGGRRRHRRGTIAGGRADGRGRARLEPRRHPHRVHRQPAAAAGPRRSLVGLRRGRRVARGDHDRRRRRHAVRRADLDAGRRHAPRHRRAVSARLLPDRDLGLRGGRVRRRPGRRHGPPRRERAEARRGPQQRRDPGGGDSRHPGRGRRDRPVHRAGRRLVRAVAGRASTAAANPSGSRTAASTCPAGTRRRPGIGTWSWRSARMRRPSPRSWRSRRARRLAARRRRER